MSIELEDYSIKVKQQLDDITKAWLIESAGEIQGATMRNSRVDTGQTKGSYDYKVNEDEAQIGSSLENAIWEEFGTGIYGQGGRQTPWVYKDRKGEFHKTRGKTANRPLQKAFSSLESKIKKALEDKLKGMN